MSPEFDLDAIAALPTFDVVDHLDSPALIIGYLEAVHADIIAKPHESDRAALLDVIENAARALRKLEPAA
jgi:hypothetical protein